MSTVSKQTALDVIAGKYDDEPIVKIVRYNNMFNGGITYATVHRGEGFMRYELSPACHNVVTVWTRRDGLLSPVE